MNILLESVVAFGLLGAMLFAGTVAIMAIRRRIFREENRDDLLTFVEMRNAGVITKEEWDRIKSVSQ